MPWIKELRLIDDKMDCKTVEKMNTCFDFNVRLETRVNGKPVLGNMRLCAYRRQG